MAITWKKLAYEDDVILKTLLDAQSVLISVLDNDPAALVVAEQEIVGRLTGGNVDGIAIGIADNNIVQIDGDPGAGEYAEFTANGLAALTGTELLADLTGDAGADFSWNNNKLTSVKDPTENQDAATKKYVDDEIATISGMSNEFIELTDTPGNYTDDGLEIVRVNVGEDALEFVAFAATYLDDTAGGTDAEVAKAPTSNVMYDHGVKKSANAVLGHVIVETASLIDVDVDGKLTLGAHASTHENGGGDEITISGLEGTSVELASHEAVKSANAVLGHVIVESASYVDVDGDGKLTLGAHAALHNNGGSDEMTLDSLGEPVAAVDFAGEQAENFVAHVVANAGARPAAVVGKICWQTDTLALYACIEI